MSKFLSPIVLVRLALGLVIIVVVLGGWTRINDAGLGCPDWPGCYGEWLVPTGDAGVRAQALYPDQPIDTKKGWLEMIHRYAATTLGLIITLLAIQAVRNRTVPEYPRKLSYFLLLLVIVQGIFGMWTVTLKLLPQIVTTHLLGGLLTLLLLIELHSRIRCWMEAVPRIYARARRIVGLVIVVVMVQIVLGGWTSSNYAGWACDGVLQCSHELDVVPDYQQGFSLPELGPNYEGGMLPLDARAAIQLVHRAGALVTLIAVAILAFWLWPQEQLRRPVVALVLLTMLQIISGFLNAVLAVPVLLAIIHHAGAVAILVALMIIRSNVSDVISEVPYVQLQNS